VEEVEEVEVEEEGEVEENSHVEEEEAGEEEEERRERPHPPRTVRVISTRVARRRRRRRRVSRGRTSPASNASNTAGLTTRWRWRRKRRRKRRRRRGRRLGGSAWHQLRRARGGGRGRGGACLPAGAAAPWELRCSGWFRVLEVHGSWPGRTCARARRRGFQARRTDHIGIPAGEENAVGHVVGGGGGGGGREGCHGAGTSGRCRAGGGIGGSHQS
jgi:hypothetical protein